MLVSGIISKDKFKWISGFIPSDAITTTEDLPTLYIPLNVHKVWIQTNMLRRELNFMGIYNENYKLCKIENGRIRYLKLNGNSIIRGYNTWIETKDNHKWTKLYQNSSLNTLSRRVYICFAISALFIM
jgi:hypothetical protein